MALSPTFACAHRRSRVSGSFNIYVRWAVRFAHDRDGNEMRECISGDNVQVSLACRRKRLARVLPRLLISAEYHQIFGDQRVARLSAIRLEVTKSRLFENRSVNWRKADSASPSSKASPAKSIAISSLLRWSSAA